MFCFDYLNLTKILLQRFTQSMRLERLSLEQGTMDGPPTQSEHAEEAEKKRLTTKVLPDTHCQSLPSKTLEFGQVDCVL